MKATYKKYLQAKGWKKAIVLMYIYADVMVLCTEKKNILQKNTILCKIPTDSSGQASWLFRKGRNGMSERLVLQQFL